MLGGVDASGDEADLRESCLWLGVELEGASGLERALTWRTVVRRALLRERARVRFLLLINCPQYRRCKNEGIPIGRSV